VEVDLRRLQRQVAEGADRQRQARRVTRKVAVIGTTGSGKTTVSRALAERLAVPHVELDALNWNPGWEETPPDEFKQRVAAALDADGWVVDGNYRGKLGNFVLDQADLVVWLDLPLRTTVWRVLRRTLKRLRTREQLWGTNVETWRDAFLRRDSLIWWALKTHFRWRRRLPELVARYPHVRLRSTREVRQYVKLGP
jgi:adenylate kinase family enzyme